jgi:uncharacterized protein YbaA (DUF1428 family)
MELKWSKKKRLEVLSNSSSADCLKRNLDAKMQLEMQFIDIFRKHDSLRFEVFQLSSTESIMEDWTNIAKTVSANQDEEIWLEQIFYRDRKQRDECIAECGKDENMNRLYKQFMDLITPGSSPIMGEFSRLKT